MIITRKFFIASLVVVIFFAFALYAGQKIMNVQVSKSQIRQEPTLFGKIIATISYGDQVNVLDKQGAWIKVSTMNGATSGWMHTSALTKKKIKMNPGDKDVEQAATSDELALAGKGFNRQVEGEFKANNPDVDFTWIDKMEGFKIKESQMESFLEQGDLSLEGGSK